MACLVQNSASTVVHLASNDTLTKRRKHTSSVQPANCNNKKQRTHESPPATSSWSPLYGGTQLDQDTIQYIHKFYCKDCRMEQQAKEAAAAAAAAAASGGAASSASGEVTVEIKQEVMSPVSPQTTMEESPLQPNMDKNKESLKRKLMMRRSLNELVDQGIYPPPKTPPAFAEQRKHLERAKTGDLLRHKIQQRPDRQLLVQQHILEDTKIDPSLHERQRLLKRARLVDNLNDKLLHRPGVLELVQGKILETDTTLLDAIQDGRLSFDKTCEGEDLENPVHFTFDETSKSSDEAPSPCPTDDSNMSDVSSPPIPMAPELPVSFTKPAFTAAQINFSEGTKITLPLSTPTFTTGIPQTSGVSVFSATSSSLKSISTVSGGSGSSSNNNKSRPKKPKPKTQPKSKVIKFHEYKGPPNVVKSQQGNAANNNSETPYHILLQQQQLFLQWQLEFQQKNINLPLLLPAQKLANSDVVTSVQTMVSVPGMSIPSVSFQTASSAIVSNANTSPITVTTHSAPQTVFTMTTTPPPPAPPQLQHIKIPPPPTPPQVKMEVQPLAQPPPQLSGQQPVPQPLSQQINNNNNNNNKAPVKKPPTPTTPKQYSNLEEMKVAELKAELKKRNLPVSGPKPQLIERLKPYADVIITASAVKTSSGPLSAPSTPVTSPASVMSPPGSVISSVGSVLSPPGSVVSSFGSLTSPPGSVKSSVSVLSPPGSVISQPPSVASPPSSVLNDDAFMSSSAVSPLPSIQAITSVVSMPSVMSPEDKYSADTPPPTPPPFLENMAAPMSPDIMDVASPPNITLGGPQNTLSNSHNNSNQQQGSGSSMPMAVDNSRPPSVAPADLAQLDLNSVPMDVEDSEFNSCFDDNFLMESLKALTSPVTPQPEVPALPTASSPQAVPPQPALSPPMMTIPAAAATSAQINQNQIQSQMQMLQQQQQIAAIQAQLLQNQAAVPNIHAQVLQEDLLKHQQHKIEELQRQLEESQLRLKLQQLQHQQLQHQQQQLQQLQQQQQQLQQLQQQQQQVKPQPLAQPQPLTQPPQPLAQPMLAQVKVPATSQPVSQPPQQKSAAPVSAPQVIFSMANGGTKSTNPTIPQIPANTKQIQIPAHLLQNLQTTQGLQTVIVTSNNKDKPTLSEFFRNQAINQSLNLGNKLVSVATAPGGLQQFIITTTTPAKTSPTSTTTLNGITQNNIRATSLPGSPVEPPRPVPQTTPPNNPFFIPLKEPPKYDEAIKSKQHLKTSPVPGGSDSTSAAAVKSQAMDDVLEILIRNGELPPSAAQEPPPTPKTTTSSPVIPTVSVAQAGKMPMENLLISSSGTANFPLLTNSFSSTVTGNTSTTTISSAQDNSVPSAVQSVSNSDSYLYSHVKKEPKMEPLSPPTSIVLTVPPSNEISTNDLLDINDVLNQDLSSMDWTSDPAFSGLDLTDTSSLQNDFDFKFATHPDKTPSLKVPTPSCQVSNHGSEPDLTSLGLGDMDANTNMQIDVPDWLDVIMPSTGMTPLSANAPVSFPSDPILTPRTQQEVLDLFNFDDTDLNTPSDLTSGTNWDKLTESAATTS